MKYQTPQLTLIGSASSIVLGAQALPGSLYSDKPGTQIPGLHEFVSRTRQIV